MPCLSGQFNPAIGILINIGVLLPGTSSVLAANPGSRPLTPFIGLIDTGARHMHCTFYCSGPKPSAHRDAADDVGASDGPGKYLSGGLGDSIRQPRLCACQLASRGIWCTLK